jgi:hypothetical protein
MLAAALSTACGGGSGDAAADSAAPQAAADAGAAADPTRAVAGAAGVPAGYTGRTDAGGEDLAGARYDAGTDGRWEVRTGPAHVVWAARDSASGRYTARARFEQLEAPTHPEAFGLVVGGRDLDGAARRYTYFVVRGTGEYLVRVREGGDTRDVQGWTAHPALAKQDAGGKATYDLAVRADADSVRFLVGDTPVHAVAAASVPADGIAGMRINHNLHLRVTPPTITR